MNIRLLKLYRERFVFDYWNNMLFKVVDKKHKTREFTDDGLPKFILNRAKELGPIAVWKHERKRKRGELLSTYYQSLKGIELRKLHNIK